MLETSPKQMLRTLALVCLTVSAAGCSRKAPAEKETDPAAAKEETSEASAVAEPAVGPMVAAVEIRCGEDAKGVCKRGDTMTFDLSGTKGYRHLALFKRSSSGVVTWYWPMSDGEAGLELSENPSVVPEEPVALASDYPVGTEPLYFVFSVDPLTRAEITEQFSVTKTNVGPRSEVVTRALTVR